MYGDFNRIVVQLVQHPVMHKPLSDLTYTECELAYALISELIDLSTEGDYTLLDYIQMARLSIIWVSCLVRSTVVGRKLPFIMRAPFIY